MKKLIILFFVFHFSFFIFHSVSAQWDVKYPESNAQIPEDIYFIDSMNGWGSGDGFIINTIDGGNTWTINYTDTARYFNQIHFTSHNIGWATANHSDIFITTDAGNTWNLVTPIQDGIDGLCPVGDRDCWAKTDNRIYHTADQGASWDLQADFDTWRLDLSFVDEMIGWVATSGGALLKTVDSGYSWDTISTFDGSLYHVSFLSEDIGFVHVHNYPERKIFKTLDGGFSWMEILSVNREIDNFSFHHPDTGYVSSGSLLYRTLNGGLSWHEIEMPIFIGEIFPICDRVWMTGSDWNHSFLLFSTDLGESWCCALPEIITLQDLYSVDFINSFKGWAVGDHGTIISTDDAGENWSHQLSGTDQKLNEVIFVDETTGWIIGDSGTILKTQNGGMEWQEIAMTTENNLIDICFIDENQGWVISENQLFTTEDGGSTWEETESNEELAAVFFNDESTGWLIGSMGEDWGLFSTKNGGLSWELVINIESQHYPYRDDKILFIDQMTGWVQSYDHQPFGGGNYRLFRTTDGGQTWEQINTTNYPAFSFADALHGFAGSRYSDGWFMKLVETNDGGYTWQDSYKPDNSWSSVQTDIAFGSTDFACLVGATGLIMTWHGPAWGINDPSYESKQDFHVFPNPTSEIVHIEYEIENPSPVSIRIFNAVGEMVAELSDGVLSKGQHKITWNAADLPAGLYFVRLKAGEETAGVKLIKQ